MNYDEARQHQETGKWAWTSYNRRMGLSVLGACAEDGGHETREEAERCYWDYCLDRLVERRWSSAQRCEEKDCGVWTNATIEGKGGFYSVAPQAFLCDDHRNRETLERLHPFRPGATLMHS